MYGRKDDLDAGQLGPGLGRNRDKHALLRALIGLCAAQPRMSQISTMPRAADMMPATRSDVSGLSSALAAKRFAARGKAANSRPSITSTRPIATMNSAISDYPGP